MESRPETQCQDHIKYQGQGQGRNSQDQDHSFLNRGHDEQTKYKCMQH